MADVYRMTIHGSEFIINHSAGGTVGVYKTETEARQEMADSEHQRVSYLLQGSNGTIP